MNYFFSCPLEGRAAIALVLILLFLLLVHKPIFKILSLLPFLLKRVFRVFYLLLEWPVFALHKSLGGVIYRVDNGLAACGEKIDIWLERWYKAWYEPKSWRKYAVVMVMVCVACYLSIVAPIAFHVESDSWKAKGWAVYLYAESTLANFLEEHGWYDPSSRISTPGTEKSWNFQDIVQIPLTVFRVPSVLRIRDIPSTLDGTTLDTVRSGEVVIWNGELTFGLAEGKQEAWAKVTTESGAEGWGRLYYLRPEEGIELKLTLTDVSEIAVSALPA